MEHHLVRQKYLQSTLQLHVRRISQQPLEGKVPSEQMVDSNVTPADTLVSPHDRSFALFSGL